MATRILFVISFLVGSLPLLAQTYATLSLLYRIESGSSDASWTTSGTCNGRVMVTTNELKNEIFCCEMRLTLNEL